MNTPAKREPKRLKGFWILSVKLYAESRLPGMVSEAALTNDEPQAIPAEVRIDS